MMVGSTSLSHFAIEGFPFTMMIYQSSVIESDRICVDVYEFDGGLVNLNESDGDCPNLYEIECNMSNLNGSA